jgi:RHS repeat-associated protein
VIGWTHADNLRLRFLYVGRFGVAWDDFGFGLGLHHMGARHYSPTLGRFLQPDPSAAEANLYGYAGDSPVTNADSQGTTTTNIGVNLAAGLAEERRVEKIMSARDWTIIRGPSTRKERTYTGPGRGYRYYDIVARKGGWTLYVEVKAGNAARNARQRARDRTHSGSGAHVRVMGSSRNPNRFTIIQRDRVLDIFVAPPAELRNYRLVYVNPRLPSTRGTGFALVPSFGWGAGFKPPGPRDKPIGFTSPRGARPILELLGFWARP